MGIRLKERQLQCGLRQLMVHTSESLYINGSYSEEELFKVILSSPVSRRTHF